MHIEVIKVVLSEQPAALFLCRFPLSAVSDRDLSPEFFFYHLLYLFYGMPFFVKLEGPQGLPSSMDSISLHMTYKSS